MKPREVPELKINLSSANTHLFTSYPPFSYTFAILLYGQRWIKTLKQFGKSLSFASSHA